MNDRPAPRNLTKTRSSPSPKESLWRHVSNKARAFYKRLNPETKPCPHCGQHNFLAEDTCRWCKRNVHQPLATKPCPHCQQQTPIDQALCRFCGKRPVPLATYPCRHCNRPVPENDVWCPHPNCGKAATTVPCSLCGTPRHPSSLWCPSCGEYEFGKVLWFLLRMWLVIGLISAACLWISMLLLFASDALKPFQPLPNKENSHYRRSFE